MKEDEAQRLSDRIQHDQTSCRCGHLLAACADCRGWLVDHSPRIAGAWRWFVDRYCWSTAYDLRWDVDAANAAEADDLAYFEAGYGFQGAR